MKKQFYVSGMNCNHCRRSVEEALNSIEGISAEVSLSPPVATVEFRGEEKSLDELQRALSDAGDYTISETPAP